MVELLSKDHQLQLYRPLTGAVRGVCLMRVGFNVLGEHPQAPGLAHWLFREATCALFTAWWYTGPGGLGRDGR